MILRSRSDRAQKDFNSKKAPEIDKIPVELLSSTGDPTNSSQMSILWVKFQNQVQKTEQKNMTNIGR